MLIPKIKSTIELLRNADKLYNEILLKYLRLSSTQRILLTYNKSQLAKGINRDGKLITPFYASIFYKGRLSPVDLKDTGKFYRSFRIAIIANKDIFIHIFATDLEKTAKLEFKYGKEIMGLTQTNIDKFIFNFKSYFLVEIEKIIKSKL